MGAHHSSYLLSCPSCTHRHLINSPEISRKLKCPDCGLPLLWQEDDRYLYGHAWCGQDHRTTVGYRESAWGVGFRGSRRGGVGTVGSGWSGTGEIYYRTHLKQTKMLVREFVCWLAGFLEFSSLLDPSWTLTPKHRSIILAHAKLCQEVCQDRLTLFLEYTLWSVMDPTQSPQTFLVPHALQEFRKYNDVLTSNELSYYLQGYFEIADSTSWNAPMVARFLQLCELNQTGLAKALREEYRKCRVWLESSPPGDSYDCRPWREALNRLFLHSIDASYGGDEGTQERWQGIHDSYKWGDDPPEGIATDNPILNTSGCTASPSR